MNKTIINAKLTKTNPLLIPNEWLATPISQGPIIPPIPPKANRILKRLDTFRPDLVDTAAVVVGK